jgi:cysteine desulfurase / selenocysteine lyase
MEEAKFGMTSSLLDRSQYPCLRDSVYLNQASLGLISQPAVTRMHTFLENVARHGNLYMSDSDEINYGQALRGVAGRLFHTDPTRIALVAGASELLGQFPLLFRLKPNATILAVSSDFPAITRPWVRQSCCEKIHVRFVDDLPDRDLTDAIIHAIDETTAVIAVSSVQYATGTLVDVRRLAASAQKVGAFLIVDATQAAGAMRVDMWKADAVVTSGYKWLGGHGGVALAAVSEPLLKQLPILPGWMSAPDPFAFDAKSVSFASDARRFTQSSMSYVSIAGLTVSIEQLLSLGENRIEAHARELAAMLVDGIREYGWEPFHEVHSVAASPHIVSLGHSRKRAREIVDKLRDQRIICSARAERVRVSLAPYNDRSDVMKLFQALAGFHSA